MIIMLDQVLKIYNQECYSHYAPYYKSVRNMNDLNLIRGNLNTICTMKTNYHYHVGSEHIEEIMRGVLPHLPYSSKSKTTRVVPLAYMIYTTGNSWPIWDNISPLSDDQVRHSSRILYTYFSKLQTKKYAYLLDIIQSPDAILNECAKHNMLFLQDIYTLSYVEPIGELTFV